MAPILIIHPKDKTTDFLEFISNSLLENTNRKLILFRIEGNKSSHEECIELIEKLPDETLTIFLGHGGSDYLCGTNTRDFTLEKFIEGDMLNVFERKKLLLISCRSEEYLKKYSTSCGIIASIGFGDLPSEPAEIEHLQRFSGEYDNINQMILDNYKKLLTQIITEALIDSLNGNFSFMQLFNRIKLRVNRSMSRIILERNSNENKKLATLLFILKNELRYFGDITTSL